MTKFPVLSSSSRVEIKYSAEIKSFEIFFRLCLFICLLAEEKVPLATKPRGGGGLRP